MLSTKTYQDAVRCFNETYPREKDLYTPEQFKMNVPRMNRFLKFLQLSLDDVDFLDIIHVTGTKGKGSTCTFTESILRHHGYKTGLLISPHLVEIRERILINGRQLDKPTFTKYFFAVHNKLLAIQESEDITMPVKTAFHVLMALYVFLEEKVDVCILEVGIGGENDNTNFIRRTVACGVTHIDVDHTDLLGNTKESIAWHKAGIFKPGAIAFTENGQEESILEVFRSRAEEKNIKVYCVPDLQSYETGGEDIKLGIPGKKQSLNASLALQLANAWLNREDRSDENTLGVVDGETKVLDTCRPFKLTRPMLEGLKEASIVCRNQLVRKPGLTYYIDGAHTYDSIQQCADWFLQEADKEAKTISGKVIKVLMFNLTGERDPYILLRPMSGIDFDAVVFCPNNIYPGADIPDRHYVNGAFEMNIKNCRGIMKAWHKLKGTDEADDEIFHCIRDALYWATQGREPGLLDEPTDVVIPLRNIDGTEVGFEKGKIASKLDLAKRVPPQLKDAKHIQILATGGLWSTGGILKLITNGTKW